MTGRKMAFFTSHLLAGVLTLETVDDLHRSFRD